MDNRTIFHIDVNSAFLSWTANQRLKDGAAIDLRDIPSAIGGNEESRHGIVLAKSIPAKKYGVVTGEPLVSARAKCPNLVCEPPDFNLYHKCSNDFMAILEDYSDRVQAYSIDEAFLEFTGMEKIFGDPIKTAHEIKDRIKNELGFTVNIGVSSNKFLAKMAGDLKKPDLVHTLYKEEIQSKMWPLYIEDLFMVGKSTAVKLRKIGIRTIGDLAKLDPKYLYSEFKSMGKLLYAYAWGIDDSQVHRSTEKTSVKSISNSSTFSKDIKDMGEAHKAIISLTESVSMRLRGTGLKCNEVSVSIKNCSFETYSKQQKLTKATDCTELILRKAFEVFNSVWKGEPIRLLGVRVGHLSGETNLQMSLFDTGEDFEKYRQLDTMVDSLRLKYGNGIIQRSTFLQDGIESMLGSSKTIIKSQL